MIPSPERYEKLGAFYLGREYDLEARESKDDLLLYDARDLTTHAVCVGMTGSGKTGLCIGLLEEAALDGVPALVIDPKGDLTNLMLTFPELRPADFEPWVDPDQAARQGISTPEFAAAQAELWRDGLAQWGQTPDRIRRLREAAEFAVYTPGSEAGRPLSVLSSFAAPPEAVRADADAMREQVSSTTTSLLALLGIDADPVRSREHILLAMLLEQAWTQGRDLDLATLIGMIQSPPIERVGVLDLDSFYPAKDRFELAMTLNSLLASPGFSAWMQGEPLDIDRLLYTESGKPRVAVVYTAHLSERERMFVVSLLLNRMVGWVRTRSGSTSLRALVYMDEVFGYMPPVAEPPSKRPLLTLLKQARAYGVGVVLATQNPVDLDYKGLSNTGTWFLGKLQTERDKKRVLDGLEGASHSGFDRARIERTLSGLGKRVFLMHNVHEDGPVIFQTRWVMSYLRGPLTRRQIQRLAQAPTESRKTAALTGVTKSAPVMGPPVLPPDVQQFYLPLGIAPGAREVVYRPAVIAVADVLFADSRRRTEVTEGVAFHADVDPDAAVVLDWNDAEPIALTTDMLSTSFPVPGSHDPVPTLAAKGTAYRAWSKDLVDWIYRNRTYDLMRSAALGETSIPGESERDFRVRLADHAREMRDAATEKLRARYASKFTTLRERIRKAEQAVEREQEQAQGATMQTAISLGATLLSALLGRKTISATTIGKATTAARGAGRARAQSQDVDRARENVENYRAQLQELEEKFEDEILQVQERLDPTMEDFERVELKPRKREIDVRVIGLGWFPWARDSAGFTPLY